jgi:hypothetical protein
MNAVSSGPKTPEPQEGGDCSVVWKMTFSHLQDAESYARLF